MSRDYKRKGASSKARSQSQVPGWVWLFTGSVIGAFVMFLVYLKDVPAESNSVLNAFKNDAPATDTTAEDAPTEDETPTPRFVFYELLKENEVVVKPDPEADKILAQPKNVEYIIQAGSYRNFADADRLRAELILLNLDAKIEKSDVGGNTWHRVMVGPFDSRAMASKARGTLASMNVDTIMRELKKDG